MARELNRTSHPAGKRIKRVRMNTGSKKVKEWKETLASELRGRTQGGGLLWAKGRTPVPEGGGVPGGAGEVEAERVSSV